MALGFNIQDDSTEQDLNLFGDETGDSYHEGFMDGVEDTFNRVIRLLQKPFNLENLESHTPNSGIEQYMKEMLIRLNKMKKRT